jgi:hypothetical protein
VKLFEDELLFALLSFLLGLPTVFVDFKAQAPALHRALTIGVSHAPCLDTALDAIERWMVIASECDNGLKLFEETMEPLLPLLLKYIGPQALVEQDAEQSALVQQLMKARKTKASKSVESVSRTQRRVLFLLGRLSFNCSQVRERYIEQERVEFAWDS